MGQKNRRLSRPTRVGIWLGVLCPIPPLTFMTCMGYGGLPSTLSDWLPLIQIYLISAIVLFVFVRSILKRIASGTSALSVILSLFVPFISEVNSDLPEHPKIPKGQALIFFYRPRAYMETAGTCTIFINGGKVANIRAGTYFYFYASAGRKEITIHDSAAAIQIDVADGQQYFVRITPKGNHFEADVVASKMGRLEIRRCKRRF